MDIGSKNGYPSSECSNFAHQPFVFDGIDCGSREGILQALKFEKAHIQIEVCKLVGVAAKNRGKEHNKQWKQAQKLWWQGDEFPRKSDEYQHLLDRIFLECARQSATFRNALINTRDNVLTHAMSRSREAETILTQHEFCSRLMSLRELLKDGVEALNKTRRL